MRLIHILLALPLLLAGTASAAEMFRWVDADGKVHYTDAPPPPTAKNVQQKKLGDKAGSAQIPYVLQQAVKNFPVTLYSNECGDACTKAKALLGKRGIPFTQKDPEKNPDDAESLKKVAGGTLTVPLLLVGTSVLKGFEEDGWNSALDLAGYPKDSLLPKSATSPAKPGTPTPPAPPPADKSPEEAATPQQPQSPQQPPLKP